MRSQPFLEGLGTMLSVSSTSLFAESAIDVRPLALHQIYPGADLGFFERGVVTTVGTK